MREKDKNYRPYNLKNYQSHNSLIKLIKYLFEQKKCIGKENLVDYD